MLKDRIRNDCEHLLSTGEIFVDRWQCGGAAAGFEIVAMKRDFNCRLEQLEWLARERSQGLLALRLETHPFLSVRSQSADWQ